MKKYIVAIILLISLSVCLFSCSGNESTFSIQFLDVGQGDSALVECDGHYMLIDGGDTGASNKVLSTLIENDVRTLDILVASHLHKDHIGGLLEIFDYVQQVNLAISNDNDADTEIFQSFQGILDENRLELKIPTVGEKYALGSATIEILDVSTLNENDSLVILITYGNTRFLFSGDIEADAQRRIADKYMNDVDSEFKINLIKMPHHGSHPSEEYKESALYYFLRTFMPDYAVISVGKGNKYNHPHELTLDMLNDLGAKTYRTDINGDIIVKSNGQEILIESHKY
ncbi:MAG: MBL fold metallo-hydrolase [Ruminococcaceae bacterium]|nr:MBL fold metallo-hydrolase [Oscillospiraceae bacterium]